MSDVIVGCCSSSVLQDFVPVVRLLPIVHHLPQAVRKLGVRRLGEAVRGLGVEIHSVMVGCGLVRRLS